MSSDAKACERCDEEIEDRPYSKFHPDDLRVCTDCWFRVLDGGERKEHAREANERRDRRLNA